MIYSVMWRYFFCLYNNIHLVAMGNSDNSSTISINRCSDQQIQEVSRLYYSKLFLNHKKTIHQFTLQINSIIKRLSYLPYEWAYNFKLQLKSSNRDQIYAQYARILKKNYRREGGKEKVFYSSKLGKCFLQHIYSQYKLDTQVISLIELKQLIREYKCYSMVINWLNQLSTTKTDQYPQKCDAQTIHPNYVQDKQAYSILLKTIMKMYSHSHDEHSLSKVQMNQTLNSNLIADQLMRLKSKSSFAQKEQCFNQIQRILINSQQEMEQNLELIKRAIGKGQMFAYLLAVRELGNVNIQFLWTKVNSTFQ